jgi:polysaccharide chain length determinant protein (PEP-CTERM system associated)
MPLRPDMTPQEYLKIFLRRKWLVVFSIVFIMFGAAIYCVAITDLYKSSTTILVFPPTVSTKYISPLSNYRIQDRIPAIQKQVLSRPRLTAVMDELGLYGEERKNALPENLVEKMQNSIQIRILKDKAAFELSFEYKDPKLAMMTVAKLSSLFIDENIRVKEQQAVATSAFLETQLNETKARLEAQEERLKRYKLHYMGELPQEMQSNLTMMNRLQDQLRSNSESISRLEDRKVFLESKISDLTKEMGAMATTSPDDPAAPLLEEIAVRKKKIRDLSVLYTPRYPTVVKLQAEVDELWKRVADARKANLQPKDNTQETIGRKEFGSRGPSREKDELTRLREQVAGMNLEISSLKKEREENRKSIDSIQTKVGRLPQREQEMISLTRDYNNLKMAYDDLLRKKLEARVSQNLEEGQKGETFQVIDPANLPLGPFKPDRLKIIGLSFLAAIAIGFGGAFGQEMLDTTLRGPKDFKYFFELPILASLPIIQEGDRQGSTRRLRTVLLVGGCTLISLATIVLIVFRDNIQTALEISRRIG